MTTLSIVSVVDDERGCGRLVAALRPVCPRGAHLVIASAQPIPSLPAPSEVVPHDQLCVSGVHVQNAPAHELRAAALASVRGEAVWILEGGEGVAHAALDAALTDLARDPDLDASAACWIELGTPQSSPVFGAWPRRSPNAAFAAGLCPPLAALVWRRSALERIAAAGGLDEATAALAGRRLAEVAVELGVRVVERMGAHVTVPRRDPRNLPDPDASRDTPVARFSPRLARLRLDLGRVEARLDDGRLLPLDAHEAAFASALLVLGNDRPRSLAGWVSVALASHLLPVDLAPVWLDVAERLRARGAFRDGGGA